MARRIAVVHEEKCKPHECGNLCMRVCPVNKTSGSWNTIWLNARNKAAIDEVLCIGCGICPKKCPFGAIDIINLPEALEQDPLHRYGRNGFHLYNIPIPVFGKVVGIVGRNGIGKSTAIKILSGTLKPNLGKDTPEKPYEAEISELIKHFRGTEAQGYFERMRDGKIKVAIKPQMVDAIPHQWQGTVRGLFEQVTKDAAAITSVAEELSLTAVLDRNVSHVSGGELQRIAIAATALKDANVYFFDEPTSYLDVKQRLSVSRFIRKLASQDKAVVVIEHDLIILDYMTELVHIMYGKENVYGVVSLPKATKTGINVYLNGYMKEENIRFRDYKIDFHTNVERDTKSYPDLVSWSSISHKLGSFHLTADSGSFRKHEVVGVLGENGTGKTSFVMMMAGILKPEQGAINEKITVSYKPQYIKPNPELLVMNVLQEAIARYKVQLITPLELDDLFERKLGELSGGQLQRVAIAAALAQEADLYLLDEPSAYLDVEQRLAVSKVIKDVMLQRGTTAVVVDHDLLFIDYLSTRLMVFEGKPAANGVARGPFGLQDGMNRFLSDVNLTFRRDEETNRPRANKPGSQMDEHQKAEKKLYYI